MDGYAHWQSQSFAVEFDDADAALLPGDMLQAQDLTRLLVMQLWAK